MDIKDLDILNILQKNSKSTNPTIGKAVGLTPSAVFERIRKLEAQGVIQSYHTRLNPRKVGLGVLAFVFLKVSIGNTEIDIDHALAQIDEVLEVYHTSGEYCYTMKVRAADADDLGRLLLEKVHPIKGILATQSIIVLKSVKESSHLPLKL
ncbi:MAG: Lrp/AsnC family transcriptional regulator [Desulfobacula sp.]|nr:Lrp/AsnC family transcriptional regulator [Desulfobacula sp.]